MAAVDDSPKGEHIPSEEERAAARREADIVSQLQREREELLEATTFFRLLWPRQDARKDDKDEKKEEETEEVERVPCCGARGIFRFADSLDMFYYTLSISGAIATGSIMPAFALVFGALIDALNDPDDVTSRMSEVSLWFVYIGLASIVLSFLEVGLATIAAERQVARAREEYCRALLRQEVAFWDDEDPGEVASRLVEDTITIQNGIGEKLSNGVRQLASIVVGVSIAFALDWALALVILAFMPLMAVPMSILKSSKEISERVSSSSYARASAAASEAIGNIRTVVAFNGQQAEARRYDKQLGVAELVTWRASRVIGLAVGMFWLAILSSYAAAFAFGGSRIRDSRAENPTVCGNPFLANDPSANCYTPGNLMQAFFSVIIGSFALGQLAPDASAFGAAQVAAWKLFKVIDRESAINPEPSAGAAPSSTKAHAHGRIEFKNVTFAYPSNKDKKVLIDFCATVEPGSTLALVGESGSGKSTIVQLLMRFYDPDEGQILLDGKDIRDYDVPWLRSQMGLVSQEPGLFASSIEENIALGLPEYVSNFGVVDDATKAAAEADGDEATKDAARSGVGKMWGVEVSHSHTVDNLPLLPRGIQKRVLEAARAASVDAFARELTKGYRTRVGEKGGQLSGGQKQRVALARAFIRKPVIFIGDEATSALDSKSEKEVKEAMDKLLRGKAVGSTGRITSVLVAHRLSTVSNSDEILVLDSGRVVERGTHAELMAAEGAYHNLAAGQGLTVDGDVDEDAAAAAAAAAAADASAIDVGAALDGSVPAPMAHELSRERSRATSVASDGSDGEQRLTTMSSTDKNDDLTVIKSRITRALAARGEGAAPIDRLFFAILSSATSPAGSSSPDAEEAGAAAADEDPSRKLDMDEPRVVLLQSCFLEMALNEKRNLLVWWLGAKPEQVTEAEEAVASGSSSALGKAVSSLAADAAVLRESNEMTKKAKANKVPIWDEKPVAAPTKTGKPLYLPPARSRNGLLRGLLLASRPAVPMGRVWSFYNSGDTPAIVAALLASALDGLVFPSYGLLLSDMLAVLYKQGQAYEDGLLTYCLAFVALGVGAMLMAWGRITLFEVIGSRLTKRMRAATYEALLKQEVGFFDYEFNATGQLTGRLAGDAALVRQTTGERIGLLLSNVSSLLTGIIIAFTASWQLTLVMLGIVPFLVLGGFIQMSALSGFTSASKEALESSAQIASEAMTSIRTVTGLGLQQHVSRSFVRSLEAPKRNAFLAGSVGGLAFGFSQFILFAMGYSLVFWSGSQFMVEGLVDFNGITKVFFALAFTASGIGNSNSIAGDKAKADAATASIFAILDRIPRVANSSSGAVVAEASSKGGDASPSAKAHTVEPAAAATAGKAGGGETKAGTIEFRDVSFSYPARPDALALRNFSATFRPGTAVALVGPSGSGKSTIVQLLMRFYDPDEGQILLDGRDIRTMDPAVLRDRLGLVGQEPVLFSDSIFYNIAYGRPGGPSAKPYPDLGLATAGHSTVVDAMPAVEKAAAAASAHDFIVNRLMLGYSSFAGMQGSSRLSGGQKQRIAIARAVVDGPRGETRGVFVGDEATSALDTQSEREVQKALDRMLAESKKDGEEGRTFVLVAHRLSTIRNCDEIFVLGSGTLQESGTHDALMAKDGLYKTLATHQQITSEADE